MRVERSCCSGWRRRSSSCCSSRCCEDILLPFVAAIVIAYFLNPARRPADALGRPARRRRCPHRRRLSPCLIVIALIFAGAAAARSGAAARRRPARRDRAPAGPRRERGRASSSAPHFPGLRGRPRPRLADDRRELDGPRRRVAGSMWSQGRALFNFLSLLLITPLVVFYLLIDWHPMLAQIDWWLPRDHAPTIRRLATRDQRRGRRLHPRPGHDLPGARPSTTRWR